MNTSARYAFFLLPCLLLSATESLAAKKLVDAPPPPALMEIPAETPAVTATAQDRTPPSRGEMLYENHCTSCHESGVHIREQHVVRNPADLRVQVRRWAEYQNLHWQDDEVEAVIQYVNSRYYRFEPQE